MKPPTWHSRLPDRKPDPVFEAMNASIGVDARLFREEIAATKAHACALRKAGVYTGEECSAVRAALCRIEDELAGGLLAADGHEDVHSLIEHRLTELAGPAGARIQTGRSRNEQTVTAHRLFLKKSLGELAAAVEALQAEALRRAEGSVDAILPGYTHQRPAQPLRFAHYLCALSFGLERDKGRLRSARARIDASPAGVGAIAGAPFGIDREALAKELGFASVSENAFDTVSDRDGPLEALSALAILMVRLSRLAEDLVLWSSPAFGFVDLGDAYCTSSSLMPQKKNPDALELVRGKTGRVISDLVSLLVTCKGLPNGYQKDLQEDKRPLFDAVDTAAACLAVCAGVLRTLRIDPARMKKAITADCLATDLADRWVEKGVPFREAYAIVAKSFAGGRASKGARGKAGPRPPTPQESAERRDSTGGNSRRAVLQQIARARKALGA
ncbi:MAG: argininosuccinate lyase [Planctomycetes bacterium]|jgi:argininosuccinate lyase|nr:argininosuccinate lyase [Planctomycetota bacterium]